MTTRCRDANFSMQFLLRLIEPLTIGNFAPDAVKHRTDKLYES